MPTFHPYPDVRPYQGNLNRLVRETEVAGISSTFDTKFAYKQREKFHKTQQRVVHRTHLLGLAFPVDQLHPEKSMAYRETAVNE